MKKIVFQIILTVIVLMAFLAPAHSQGANAIDFTAVDINGNNIKLSDYHDNVVILDFWATWCGPCRREIPHLIDIKNTFKDKKFEIISIALERGSEDAAIQFVKQKKMNWIHIVNKKITTQLAQKYQIKFIPTMFIIQKGKIIATGLRGQALKNKIQQLVM